MKLPKHNEMIGMMGSFHMINHTKHDRCYDKCRHGVRLSSQGCSALHIHTFQQK